MANEIYCYGGIDIYRDVFNAIAMLNGDRSFMQSLIAIGVIVGGFWTMITLVFGDFIKPFLNWVLPMAILQTAFLTPTATVHLIDVVQAGRHEAVDHVPYGLALVAGTLSRLSHKITEKTEVFFTLPDDLKYSRSGGIFAANLLENQKMMAIQDEDFAENMRSFIGQCVLYDLALGRKYTIKNLRNTPNIWGLISANASPARSFVWKEGFNRGDIITCAEGVQRFNQSWAAHVDQTACAVGSKLYPNHDQRSPTMIDGGGGISSGSPSTCRSPLARQEFLKYLPLQYGALAGMTRSSTNIIQQHMMISALIEAQDHASVVAGNVPNFPARKAYLQQRSSYETIGHLASDTLPIMRAVLELICYSIFLFIIPILVLPMGYRVLVSWTQTILWLALWPPMYAILHLIMVSAISLKTKAYMGISNPNGITLASSLGVQNISADMAAMAGYLSLSLPFICIAIVKGVSSFVHMASSLGAVSQGAASSAATEALAGNYSIGNTSMDNHSFGNMNQLSQNYDASLSMGSFRMQEGHTSITTSASGGMVANVEQSNLPVSINMAQSLANSKRMAAHQELSTGQSMMQSAERSVGSSVEQLGNLGKTLSNSTNIQEGWSEQQQQEAGKAMQMTDAAIDKLSKSMNISKGRAAAIMAGVGAPGIGEALFGAKFSSEITSSSNSQELVDTAKDISKQMNFEENAKISAQASQHLSKHSSDDTIQSYARNHQATLNETARDSTSAQKHLEASKRLSNEADTVESQSATINRNMNDKFVEWLSNQEAPNSGGGVIGNRGAVAMIQHKPDEAAHYANHFMREQMPKMSLGVNESSLKSDYHTMNMPSVVDKGVVDRLGEDAREKITHDLENKANGMEQRVNAQIEGTTHFIEGAKEDVLNPRREELQNDYDRQSTDVGITTAIGGVFKAINNTADGPGRFVEERVENLKEGYANLIKGPKKEDMIYSDLPSMINASIQSGIYPSVPNGSQQQNMSDEKEYTPQILNSNTADVKSVSADKTPGTSDHPRNVESLFQYEATAILNSKGNDQSQNHMKEEAIVPVTHANDSLNPEIGMQKQNREQSAPETLPESDLFKEIYIPKTQKLETIVSDSLRAENREHTAEEAYALIKKEEKLETVYVEEVKKAPSLATASASFGMTVDIDKDGSIAVGEQKPFDFSAGLVSNEQPYDSFSRANEKADAQFQREDEKSQTIIKIKPQPVEKNEEPLARLKEKDDALLRTNN